MKALMKLFFVLLTVSMLSSCLNDDSTVLPGYPSDDVNIKTEIKADNGIREGDAQVSYYTGQQGSDGQNDEDYNNESYDSSDSPPTRKKESR